MIVGMITGKKVFWNCIMDVITSRVEYRSSVFIKTVFEATFSFSNILYITQATLNQIDNIKSFTSNQWDLLWWVSPVEWKVYWLRPSSI